MFQCSSPSSSSSSSSTSVPVSSGCASLAPGGALWPLARSYVSDFFPPRGPIWSRGICPRASYLLTLAVERISAADSPDCARIDARRNAFPNRDTSRMYIYTSRLFLSNDKLGGERKKWRRRRKCRIRKCWRNTCMIGDLRFR